MKVALELPPHTCLLEVHLAEFRGNEIHIAKQGRVEFELAGYQGQSVFRRDPWLTMEPEAIIEFYNSMTKELQRLGLIRPTPSADEIRSLESQLYDARKVRDKLLDLVVTGKIVGSSE